MTLFQLSYLTLWAVALVLAPLTAVLLYQFSLILAMNRLHENSGASGAQTTLAAGRLMPEFSGQDLRSGLFRGTNEWKGTRFVLLALSPTCATCKLLALELTTPSHNVLLDTTVVALCVGSHIACRDALASAGSIPVLRVNEDHARELTLAGLPIAITVDDKGVVEEIAHPNSITEVARMLSSKKSYNHDVRE